MMMMMMKWICPCSAVGGVSWKCWGCSSLWLADQFTCWRWSTVSNFTGTPCLQV